MSTLDAPVVCRNVNCYHHIQGTGLLIKKKDCYTLNQQSSHNPLLRSVPLKNLTPSWTPYHGRVRHGMGKGCNVFGPKES